MRNGAPLPEAVDEVHLYEQVTSELSKLIETGTLRPGERVPSVRKLSVRRRISLSTVMQAYRVLESRGLIEARPRSGYYVRARRWTPPPEPEMTPTDFGSTKLNVGELIMQICKDNQHPSLVRLGATCTNNSHHPTPELHRSLAAMARRCVRDPLKSDSLSGTAAIRTQIARRALDSGCVLSPSEIIATTGATESVHLSLRAVTKPGDTVAIESPTYFGILQLIETLGLRALELPTHPRDGVSLEALEYALEHHDIKACLFVLNFNNPLGSCLPDENKARLVELLAAREIPLIENDLYGDLAFDAVRPRTAKSFDRQGGVLLCDSFNKSLSCGYRVGWVAPGRFQARIETIKFTTTEVSASLPQLALADFLANGGYDAHLRRLRRFFAEQVQRMTEAVTRLFPVSTKVTRPRGGQVLWVELPAHIDSMEVYRQAIQERIAIAPGQIFSAKRKFRNYLRLNCGNPWTAEIEQAMKRLGAIIGELDERGRNGPGFRTSALAQPKPGCSARFNVPI
ncbi:MAG: PLP-dependent aminotransferase family protein [Verrucomicrobia bacterium]|nr:PLP-dependent aminotransferase family protein [Verrucomicrobiota bacterium]